MSETVIDSIKQIGRVVAEFRAQKGLSQAQLAEQLSLPRTTLALLEQGQRLPSTANLESILTKLQVPRHAWLGATNPGYLQAMEFQELLGDMVGKPITLSSLDAATQELAIDSIAKIFKKGMSDAQTYDHFNSILTFYGEKSVERPFFDRFLSKAFESIETFQKSVREFQRVAIRVYGSFRFAFKRLRSGSREQIQSQLSPLEEKSEDTFTQRRPFDSIQELPPDRLDDLGYISAERVKRESKERHELSGKLLELAKLVREDAKTALEKSGAKRINRIQSLLRKFESKIETSDNLFYKITADALEAEAKRLAPEDRDLARIEATQETGLRNLTAYLTEPFMDVYVATSMRTHADFVSANGFIKSLFADPTVSHLNLRYFNPTQSWVEDRVAKGLVEALMLRRSRLTVYMAQKGDTFGKDSEASVALGQGKAVVVYVPKLADKESEIDSESLTLMTDADLSAARAAAGIEEDEGVDRQGLVEQILVKQLGGLSKDAFIRVLRRHWADFDLYDSLDTAIPSEKAAKQALDSLADPSAPELDPVARETLTKRLVATATHFEKRARTFRVIHPLALQVIVRTGVLNGIVVVRSASSCALAVKRLLTNTIKTRLDVDEKNYTLIDVETGSILRVISKFKILTNAFWTQYFDSEVE